MIKHNSQEEFKKFIQILETADGGCSYCVIDLLEKFIEKFPNQKEVVEQKIFKIKRDLETN